MTPDGIIQTLAGTGTAGYSGDGIKSTAAELNGPRALAMTEDGAIYISDTNNERIRKIDGNGIISTVAGTGI